MSEIHIIDIDLDDADVDGIAATQAVAGAGNLTLNGALGTTLDYGRAILIGCTGADAARTFTVTGTDANGKAITEAIAGSNASTTLGTKFFKTVTSIAADAACAGSVYAGTNNSGGVAASKVIPLNYRARLYPTYIVNVTGTINYTIEETFEPLESGTAALVWMPLSAHTSKTADTNAIGTVGTKAIRVKINSYSPGGELQCYVTTGTSS